MLAFWQSNSVSGPAPLAAIALVALLLSASLTLWIRCAGKAYEGTPILPYEPRRPVPWSILEIVLLVPIFLGAIYVFQMIYLGPPSQKQAEISPEALAVDTVSKLTVLAAALVIFRLMSRATPEDWGLVWPRPGRDLFIAAVAAAMLLPLVYGLNFLMTLLDPTQHPLLRALTGDRDPLLVALAVVSAGVVAPIWEELFFRVIFQGWLESLLLHRAASSHEAAVVELAPDPEAANHYAIASEGKAPRGWWLPILISSTVFAAVHIDLQNPRLDILPLFFFALGLGYLYQRTHRALPSIALHMILNLTSLAMLFAAGASGSEVSPSP